MLKMISWSGARANLVAADTDVSDINMEDKVDDLAINCAAGWRSFELCINSLSGCA